MQEETEKTDCGRLKGRLRSICDGTSGLSEDLRQRYIDKWRKEGRLKPRGLGDVIHSALTRMRVVRLAKRLFRNCGCERRRALLNRLFPFRRGSDTMAALPDDRATPTPEQGGHV